MDNFLSADQAFICPKTTKVCSVLQHKKLLPETTTFYTNELLQLSV